MVRSRLLLLLLLLPVSCGTDKSANTPAAPAAISAPKTMSQRFNGPAIKQNANGEWPAEMHRFSAYDASRQSAYFNEKSTIAKPYNTGQYAKTEWKGKTNEVPRTAYTGNTDGNRFRKASRIAHDDAHEAGASDVATGTYKTGDYKTSSARENNAKRLDKPSDAATDARRRVFPEPEISSWKEQRAMDMKTTRSILGRDQ